MRSSPKNFRSLRTTPSGKGCGLGWVLGGTPHRVQGGGVIPIISKTGGLEMENSWNIGAGWKVGPLFRSQVKLSLNISELSDEACSKSKIGETSLWVGNATEKSSHFIHLIIRVSFWCLYNRWPKTHVQHSVFLAAFDSLRSPLMRKWVIQTISAKFVCWSLEPRCLEDFKWSIKCLQDFLVEAEQSWNRSPPTLASDHLSLLVQYKLR